MVTTANFSQLSKSIQITNLPKLDLMLLNYFAFYILKFSKLPCDH